MKASSRALLAGAAASLMASPALAADLSFPEPAPAPLASKIVPPPPPGSGCDSSGFYAGLQAGFLWGSFDPAPVDTLSLGGEFPAADLKGSAPLYGAHVGYDCTWRSFLFGLEADGSLTNIDEGDSFSNTEGVTVYNWKTDGLATLRARAGLVLGGGTVLYGTGGLALGHIGFGTSSTFNTVEEDASSGDTWALGWVIGAGVEVPLSRHWKLVGQYLHADLGAHDFTVQATPVSVKVIDDVATLGFSYHW